MNPSFKPEIGKRSLVTMLLTSSGITCAYSVTLSLLHSGISHHLAYAWLFVFSILIALWVHADTRSRSIHQPLDFGFVFLWLWPLALPYYLIKTRGAIGLAPCAGFFAVYLAPFVLAWFTYVLSSKH